MWIGLINPFCVMTQGSSFVLLIINGLKSSFFCLRSFLLSWLMIISLGEVPLLRMSILVLPLSTICCIFFTEKLSKLVLFNPVIERNKQTFFSFGYVEVFLALFCFNLLFFESFLLFCCISSFSLTYSSVCFISEFISISFWFCRY